MNYSHNLAAFKILTGYIIFICHFTLNTSAQENVIKLGSHQAGWQAIIDNQTGVIVSYQTWHEGKWDEIDFRKDKFAGPAWKDVPLTLKDEKKILFEGNKNGINYSLQYLTEEGHLVVRAGMKNGSEQFISPLQARLIIGINSEMKTYPEWDNRFFPTLLRCEKTHFWGYFMSPKKRIFAVGVSDPVASYTINYIYEGLLEWKWGHQIFTASLDLLHQLPLPARHPQNQSSMNPGEYKKWDIHMGEVDSLSKVKVILSEWLKAPMIESERYTIAKGENTVLTINSSGKIAVQLIPPSGSIKKLSVHKKAAKRYTVDLNSDNLDDQGLYAIQVTDLVSNKTAEATINVREPFSWYMIKARDNAFTKKPIISESAESSYGFYAAFLARKYFPDKEKDSFLENLFNSKISLAFDLEKGQPLPDVSPQRVQNISTAIGLYTDLWEATKDTAYILCASRLGDYIASPVVQKEDGSYRSGKTHYTAVIYPAKSMLELAAAEKELATTNNFWRQRYTRHTVSAEKAITDLQLRLDDIETEGDMAFEDGMITCSALQLGLGALVTVDMKERALNTKAAAYMMDKHTCLEQNLIPDARMRGATLRFWEALDIYFVPNQIMCSPHGWTAWKIYADYYLYLLTGNEKYLNDFMDTLDSCLQVIDDKGELRWGFVPDPYIKAQQFVPESPGSIKGKKIDTVVGEQYLPMITGWFRPYDENKIVEFGDQGGSGDNTVYEIFKALEACALNKAYVIMEKDGTLKTWNCSARKEHGIVVIIPSEEVVSKIHLNMGIAAKVHVLFAGKEVDVNTEAGLRWVSKDGVPEY